VNDSRRLVYVSGAPGSGKTSLAVPLAAELGYALLTKDRIKEILHDALGASEPDRAWSRRLGGAAMELLWALVADAPAVVIEANFRPYSEYERAKLSGLAAIAQPVEVHCACPPELAVNRYNARVAHPVHVVTTLQMEAMSEYDRPVGIGALVTVDTTVPVDVTAVAAEVRDCYDRTREE
jgi:predicted kinase